MNKVVFNLTFKRVEQIVYKISRWNAHATVLHLAHCSLYMPTLRLNSQQYEKKRGRFSSEHGTIDSNNRLEKW